MEKFCNPIVTKSKPKVEPPPKNEDKEAKSEEKKDNGKEEMQQDMNSEDGKQQPAQENIQGEQAEGTDKKELEMEVD